MSSEDNRKKAQSGVRARKTLESAVADLRADGFILDRQKRPLYGYAGYDEDQFYVPETITLLDGHKVLLYSTNSIRSDRTKENQWDASNIKNIDSGVTWAWIVVPDEGALVGQLGFRDKIRKGRLFSAIDDIVTVEEFIDKVRDNALSHLELVAKEEEKRLAAVAQDLGSELLGDVEFESEGSQHDFVGRRFENLFAAILDNEDNIKLYRAKALSGDGYHYDVFYRTMMAIGVRPGEVREVAATSQIRKLPNGGNPKADVKAMITQRNGEQREVTFSCKSTKRKTVSVHEYSADAFADVLDPQNKHLRKLLNLFQSAGSASGMPEGTAKQLAQELKPYLIKLDKWALGGYGAPDVTPSQCAQYLVAHDKNTNAIRIHNVVEFYSALEDMNKGDSGFGTIFSWTYPSKKRGKRIQLKVDVFWGDAAE